MKASSCIIPLQLQPTSGTQLSAKPSAKEKPGAPYELSCCPDARLIDLYNLLNKKYFKRKCPPNLQIGWTSLFPREANHQTLAVTVFYYHQPFAIWLDRDFHIADDGLWYVNSCKLSLLHEMSHIDTYHAVLEGSKDFHGVEFQNRMKKLAREDAFKDCW